MRNCLEIVLHWKHIQNKRVCEGCWAEHLTAHHQLCHVFLVYYFSETFASCQFMNILTLSHENHVFPNLGNLHFSDKLHSDTSSRCDSDAPTGVDTVNTPGLWIHIREGVPLRLVSMSLWRQQEAVSVGHITQQWSQRLFLSREALSIMWRSERSTVQITATRTEKKNKTKSRRRKTGGWRDVKEGWRKALSWAHLFLSFILTQRA